MRVVERERKAREPRGVEATLASCLVRSGGCPSMCGAVCEGWGCTRSKGHLGVHAAHGIDLTKPVVVWD